MARIFTFGICANQALIRTSRMRNQAHDIASAVSFSALIHLLQSLLQVLLLFNNSM